MITITLSDDPDKYAGETEGFGWGDGDGDGSGDGDGYGIEYSR